MSASNYAPGTIAICICDRCGLKAKYSAMVQDPVKQGVWLHPHCADKFSPWQLPMQISDNYVLQHPRPDSYLTYNYYVVNDKSPVIVVESIGDYPKNSFAANTQYVVPSLIIETNDNEPIESGPESPPANQKINMYIPPSQRKK